MKREFLQNLKIEGLENGLPKEVISAILDEHHNSKGTLQDKIEELNNKIDTLSNEKMTLKDENKTLSNKVNELENVDIEKLKSEQFELGKKEGSQALDEYKKSTALKEKLGTFKTKDIDLLEKLLDKDSISFEEKDGKLEIKGLDEQIESIKTSRDYLFEATEPKVEEKTGFNLGTDNQSSEPNNNMFNFDFQPVQNIKK